MKMKLAKSVLILVLTATYAAAQAGSTSSPLPNDFENSELNQLTVDVSAGLAYDDNASAINQNQNSGFRSSVEPGVFWDHNNARMGWRIGAGGGLLSGFGQSTVAGNRNTLNASAEFGYRYMITPQFRWVIFDHFNRTSDIFNSLANNQPTNFINPFAVRVAHTPGTDFTYFFSTRSILTVGGNYSLVRYMDVGPVNPTSDRLLDSEVRGGHTYFMRHLTEKQWIGAEYDIQDIRTRRGFEARTIAHDFFIMDQYAIRPELVLSVFGGPELAHVNSQILLPIFGGIAFVPFVHESWGTAGGATISLITDKTTVDLKLFRRITEGQGVFGTMRLNSATLDARRQMTRRWDAILDGLYENGRLVDLFSGGGLRSWSVGPGVGYRLTPQWTVELHFERFYQNRYGFVQNLVSQHNRGFVTVHYTFKHHLGS